MEDTEISMKYEISNLFLANKITANTFASHPVNALKISHRPSLAGIADVKLRQVIVFMRGAALALVVRVEKVTGMAAAVKGTRNQAPWLLICAFYGIQFGIFK
ncbi:hypothetical protein [Polaromonas sp. OV174]|uniref:hypothetical protein n=1 Tax=Polaromonas sp. OV174 TaxID=1855300 RepID=UPI001160B7E1|nr:hypothetical protein [Polaromonas sp. OV174]